MNEAATKTQRETSLPSSQTITVQNHKASPGGEVEVEPNIGRIHFVNQDDTDYRLRFWKEGTTRLQGSMDIVLPAAGTITVAIKTGDAFRYLVLDDQGKDSGGLDADSGGGGGGPIKN